MLKYNQQIPILLIVFNRPGVTRKVFEAIKKAEPAKLYIAADAPRTSNEKPICDEVKDIFTAISWNCSVNTLFSETNLGCREAVSTAITWFFENEPEGIILEDDCLPSESFFGFCSTLLEKYRYDERIAHIAGCNFQFGNTIGDASYYFSDLYNIWGWASWRRVWKDYDKNLSLLDSFVSSNGIENTPSYFPFKKFWLSNFIRTKTGEIDTWDYQYMFSNIINHRLAIVPNVNLISNIGFGEGATHTTEINDFANIPLGHLAELIHPSFITPNLSADLNHLKRAFKFIPRTKKSFVSKLWKAIKQTFKEEFNKKEV